MLDASNSIELISLMGFGVYIRYVLSQSWKVSGLRNKVAKEFLG